jgi:hypothetical protein
MILIKTILVLYILPFVDVTVYVYNTVDSSSVEFYDCILYGSFFYCRRPTEPIALNRSNDTMQCYHNGTVHSFADMYKSNVSISTVLHQWRSSIEKVEQYSRYKTYPSELDEYVCECRDSQAFGKNCEYLLPIGTTFAQTLIAENSLLKGNNSKYVQRHGDIICYMTLECNSGLLCLDWRDICDGVQQCMSGLDEEHCDKLEFNECENDEYRCMNGMCIPEEYFLDGEFDCLDWSDEFQYYDDTNCFIEGASTQCDDRICPPNQYSCGDGQCIPDRFEFQTKPQIKSECRSRRDQFFICETHYITDMWTLPNGRCCEGKECKESNVKNRTMDEGCEYYLRCDLSGAVEVDCPCGNDTCNQQLNATCSSNTIQYPKGGIMAPYILFYYRTLYELRPNFILINGTLKCEGNSVDILGIRFEFNSKLREVEYAICQWAKNRSLLDNHDASQYDHRNTLTFNNRSYSWIDVCNKSKKYVSTYRIKDGFENCVNKTDEIANISTSTICSNMQRYRFYCSADEPTCLSVTALGNLQSDCKNNYDELWFGTSTKLVNINCNKLWKDQCEILQQYIERSWTFNNVSEVSKQLQLPFRHYCDTVWNLASKEDENLNECQESWICPDEQWRCGTGQCIDEKWVLDGEWDCFDASDEDNIFSQLITDRNLQVVPLSTLINRSIELSESKPFSKICNLTTELPCFPLNFSNPLDDLKHNRRPCINLSRIGDGHIDCYGAIDERNTIPHCSQPTMLGYNFKCNSSEQCIPYWDHCLGFRCATLSDDQFWCEHRKNTTNYTDYKDSVCFDGKLMKNRRCNRVSDCSFGEDEYMCEYQDISKLTSVPYRTDKDVAVKYAQQKLRLIRFPTDSNITAPTIDPTSTTPTIQAVTTSLNNTAPIAYWCNRGVGIQIYNGSIACFCPPQYYGDKCQFHTDRITVLVHLNLSQSIYTVNSDMKIVLKFLILFLFNNETITNNIFHVRPADEITVYTKKMIHFLYSRSFRLLQHKRQRYLNQSNITNDHPYSIRIEMYERQSSDDPIFIGVWQYPVYFDYLPVFRFSKVLHLTKSNREHNLCSSNPCNPNQECQQIINKNSEYICLCKSNFTGENCSIEDQQCIDGYCSFGSLCKPNYRGILIGTELPYCICPFDRYGERCDIKNEQCLLTPCQNNGRCFTTSKPDTVTCICTDEYYGKNCELRKPELKIHINESVNHDAAVVQYFNIDFISLNLILVHQVVYQTLPTLLEYRHREKIVPEIILVKLYSSQIRIPVEFYLISVHINVTKLYATTQVIKKTQCIDFRILISKNQTQNISNYSPIKYHDLCRNNTNLFCFRDDFYLCICGENHSRVECFRYDYTLDQCSYCLAGGRCLIENPLQPKDFICLCPPCYSGTKCQFNSNSFVFTLDQLFLTDLTSVKQKITLRLLIIGPFLLVLIALPNNIFSFVTFRRQKCLCNGVGQYLFFMSIINQISLSVLAARLIHLSITITGFQSNPIVDNILCKVLNYLLICFTRIAYWLISFVATERVYTTVFLKGQWLKKPYIARRLIVLTCFIIFSSGAYELVFVKSFLFSNDDHSNMCVIDFPIVHQSTWMLIHRIVSITNSMLPLLINICCTITMIYVITKSKMNILMPDKGKLLLCLLLVFLFDTLKSF